MKTFLQSLLNIFRLYKWATILNIIGLSLAFMTFCVIFKQSWYEFNFNRSIPEHERIYRFEFYSPEKCSKSAVRPMLLQLFRDSPHLKAAGMIHFSVGDASISNPEKPEVSFSWNIKKIDKGYTDVFGFKWVSGDISNFGQSEKNVVIPRSLAKKMFGTFDVAGKSIISYKSKNVFETYDVVAVYEDFLENTSIFNDVYVNLGESEKSDWGNSNYTGYVKIDSPENIENILSSVVYPGDFFERWSWIYGGSDFKARLFALDDIYFHSQERDSWERWGDIKTTWFLLSIGCLILFIATINFINFSMALAPTRIKSINTQKVLGASTVSLRIQYLMECIAVSFIAYLISLIGIQFISNSAISKLFIVDISLKSEIESTFFCGGISILIGFLAGIWPSIYITSVHPALALKGSFNLSPKGLKLRNILIGLQYIITFVLLIVTVVFYLQNRYLMSAPLGFDKERIVAMEVQNRWYMNNDRIAGFEKELEDYAGTEFLFHSDNLLLNKANRYQGWGQRNENDENVNLKVLLVDRDFITALGIDILDGRGFNTEESSGKALVNESARKEYGFKIGDIFRNYEIVGFIPDLKIFSFHQTSNTPFGLFLQGRDDIIYIKLKPGVDEQEAFNYCCKLAEPLSTRGGNIRVRMLKDVAEELYEKDLNQMYALSLFCGLSMFIAIMGVFGLVIFELQSRRKEIAIRKMNGATASSIIFLFNKTYIRITAICFVIAAPIAWYLANRWLESFVYHIPLYGWVFAVAFIVLLLITVITVSVQCWRTANENPIESLKSE